MFSVNDIELVKVDMEKLTAWENKPLLREAYGHFYTLIHNNIDYNLPGSIVEIGSGISKSKEYIGDCICTDVYQNPWVDRVENAYKLSFENESVSNIILFDVFHHLKFPGTALMEFHRVLCNRGKVIIFEPSMSIIGIIVYGIFHKESLGLKTKISFYDDNALNKSSEYYAAQGNASRIFNNPNKYKEELKMWSVKKNIGLASMVYFFSGGYTRNQFISERWKSVLLKLDKFLDILPSVFAARKLVVIEKKSSFQNQPD